ncbi:MAG: cAMP-activated global transcriptional regulator CRP [Pseudomonadota bacterium]
MSAVVETATFNDFFSQCRLRVFPPKSVVISAGEYSDELFYLVKGSVSVLIEDDGGHEIVLAYLNEGDFFGEIGMFDERHERSAWVAARTEVEVAQMSYEDIREMAVDSPDVVLAMLSQMANRLQRTNRKVGDLAYTDTTGRVARALMDLCDQPDSIARPDGKLIRITRQELGRLAGCSREMASRVLHTLAEQNVIAIDGRDIVVLNRD